MSRRFLTTKSADFVTIGVARPSRPIHWTAAGEEGDRRPSTGPAAPARLYPATDDERREHCRTSLRRTLTTFALVVAILALFLLFASS